MHHSTTMKTVFVCAVLCVVAALTVEAKKETYTTKWDGIDLDQILNSDRLLKNYMNCLMDRGRCTPDGSELKRTLPEALANDCDKCTENQKKGSDKVIRHLRKNKQEWWTELQAKYDPKERYISRHPELLHD